MFVAMIKKELRLETMIKKNNYTSGVVKDLTVP